jgi:hypothetical protein
MCVCVFYVWPPLLRPHQRAVPGLGRAARGLPRPPRGPVHPRSLRPGCARGHPARLPGLPGNWNDRPAQPPLHFPQCDMYSWWSLQMATTRRGQIHIHITDTYDPPPPLQVGEALQVSSGGLLRATPHCVLAPSASAAAAAAAAAAAGPGSLSALLLGPQGGSGRGGGAAAAAPHLGGVGGVTRSTLAVFMQPQVEQPMAVPPGGRG